MTKNIQKTNGQVRLILKGSVSGKEELIFVPEGQNASILHATSPEILASSIRKEVVGGRVELTYDQLPSSTVSIDGENVEARLLSQLEELEFARYFGKAETTLHFDA